MQGLPGRSGSKVPKARSHTISTPAKFLQGGKGRRGQGPFKG